MIILRGQENNNIYCSSVLPPKLLFFVGRGFNLLSFITHISLMLPISVCECVWAWAFLGWHGNILPPSHVRHLSRKKNKSHNSCFTILFVCCPIFTATQTHTHVHALYLRVILFAIILESFLILMFGNASPKDNSIESVLCVCVDGNLVYVFVCPVWMYVRWHSFHNHHFTVAVRFSLKCMRLFLCCCCVSYLSRVVLLSVFHHFRLRFLSKIQFLFC